MTFLTGFDLPMIFAGLMGLSILIYVVLDGFDLGVGILLPVAAPAEKDRMVASIGPFWDANETWLVLAVGLLLVAFPAAHGMILGALYLPVAAMLIGLILRGVAFEFRAKADPGWKPLWDRAFWGGSLLTALAQGFMLGLYTLGLQMTPATLGFAVFTAICVTAGYAFIGAGWLIIKTDGALQQTAIRWAQRTLLLTAFGFLAISVVTPLVSPRIFARWFEMPALLLLAPLPILAGGLMLTVWFSLARLRTEPDRRNWLPFAGGAGIFTLAFLGLAWSFLPYIVPDRLTIHQAASAPESLAVILVGTLFVLPVILGYSALSYRVFRGKATELRYD
jgi:cytochrome bd ubiquinol oxidase subunit II